MLRRKSDKKVANILESIVNMAGLLHLPIVVEGVENESQEKFVQKLGCRYIQGFYYYKPLSIKKFEELLRDKRQIDTQGLVYKQVEPMHIQ
ncbi:MAG: EAL domain-containing protein [Anaerobutyricum sp.]